MITTVKKITLMIIRAINPCFFYYLCGKSWQTCSIDHINQPRSIQPDFVDKTTKFLLNYPIIYAIESHKVNSLDCLLQLGDPPSLLTDKHCKWKYIYLVVWGGVGWYGFCLSKRVITMESQSFIGGIFSETPYRHFFMQFKCKFIFLL